ncbi:hypothetical protein NDU88_001504 [Pleurodeles waltl]|uniref:Uncharacterized protein n=1 Tax=Pleurodeles waltl TaxID=8319 RepID=A0AAV7WII1_PLEWA|nr:hypothetical protein NDU88_001504 [Pleurodeles waltl]
MSSWTCRKNVVPRPSGTLAAPAPASNLGKSKRIVMLRLGARGERSGAGEKQEPWSRRTFRKSEGKGREPAAEDHRPTG